MSGKMVDSVSVSEKHFKPVPVYNYPEHLNPFYQDENHKRLRFFSITRKKDGRPRSNSFSVSVGNLRDLWSFKSFRLRKKSSTLGISKTSESPPPLRKQDLYDSNYNTYNSTCRQTINGSGYIGSGDAFQRNTPYRASLGNLNTRNYDTQSDIVFSRTDGYRNTIQNVHSGQRYKSPSSVTPVLEKKYVNGVGMTQGVSQTSLRSTNPFEDEDDGTKAPPRRYRKKRPAPPPPVQSKYVSRVSEQQQHDTSNNIELKIVEEDIPNELPSISSLTAEIEILTKGVEETVEVVTPEEPVIPPRRDPRPSSKEESPPPYVPPSSPPEQTDSKEEQEVKVSEEKVVKVEEEAPKVLEERPDPVVKCDEPPEADPVIVTVKEKTIEEKQRVNVTDEAKIDSLRIVEPDRYEIRYVPLKEEPSRKFDKETIRADFIRTSSTTDIETAAPEVPYSGERRRSVKDIIEAINRNQGKLMATNYTPMHGKYEYGKFSDKPVLPPRYNERGVDVEALEDGVELRKKDDRGSYYDNVPEMIERLDAQSSMFERCSSMRKPSPPKSPSFEWNPVPKPRRSHNFSASDVRE